MKTVTRGPDFIGIGAAKCGTTWLYECLKAHPEISMSHPKELNYFNRNYENGRAWYEGHFSQKQTRLAGEISPSYISDPLVAGRIKQEYPGAKILAMLRNPFERIISHFQYSKQLGYSINPSEMKIANGGRPEGYAKVIYNTSLYHASLAPYYQMFGGDAVMVYFYDDLKEDPERLLKRVYADLGVDSGFLPEMVNDVIGETKETRSVVLNKLAYSAGYYLKNSALGYGLYKALAGSRRLTGAVWWLLQRDGAKGKVDISQLLSETQIEEILADIRRLKDDYNLDVPAKWLEADGAV